MKFFFIPRFRDVQLSPGVTCKLVGNLAVLHTLRLGLFRIEGHILLANAFHILIVSVLWVSLDDEHRTARGALHGKLPYFCAVVCACLIFRGVEARTLCVESVKRKRVELSITCPDQFDYMVTTNGGSPYELPVTDGPNSNLFGAAVLVRDYVLCSTSARQAGPHNGSV